MAVWTKTTKSAVLTWSKPSIHTSVWTKTTRSAVPTWGKGVKHTSVWTKTNHTLSGYTFLLLEQGGYLLLESGSKIILEQSSTSAPIYTHLVKS